MSITGDIARRQVHMMRADADAVLIGIGTALEDDPELTVRLPGLFARSPARIVLDRQARLPATSALARPPIRCRVADRRLRRGRRGAEGRAGTGRREVPGNRDL